MAASNMILKGEVRGERGKEWAKKARRDGRVPGVVYGAGADPVAVTFDAREFLVVRQQILGERVLLNLELSDGKKEKAFIKYLQRDPVSDQIIHIDMLRVDPSKVVHLPVRVRIVGSTPQGVKDGGLLEKVHDEVNIEALPDNVPAHIEVDLSDLRPAHSLHVRELPKIEGVTYMDRPDSILFTIVAKSSGSTEAEAAAAQAAGTEASQTEA